MIEDIVKRIEGVLEALDALASDNGSPEELEELNAELEDALLMLSGINPREEDWEEELAETLEDVRALAVDYRRLGRSYPDVDALAASLEQAAEEA